MDTNNKQAEKAEDPRDTVQGFSDRFNTLLDLAGVVQGHGRFSAVGELLGASISTARAWCTMDRAPRTKEMLNTVVQILMPKLDAKAELITSNEVKAWLIYGVGDPFQETDVAIDAFTSVMMLLHDISKSKNIVFESLPLPFRSKLVKKAVSYCNFHKIDINNPEQLSDLRGYLSGMMDVSLPSE